MTKHLMADIETMSLSTNNAIVLSVGLVAWSMNADGYQILGEKVFVLDVAPQLIAGREVQKKTQKFWQDQDPAASEHLETGERIHPRALASRIGDMMRALGLQDADVWSRGVVFDIGNLNAIFEQYGQEAPWKYNKVSDARTIIRHNPLFREGPGYEGRAHDPVDDCKFQIADLWEHYAFGDTNAG